MQHSIAGARRKKKRTHRECYVVALTNIFRKKSNSSTQKKAQKKSLTVQ